MSEFKFIYELSILIFVKQVTEILIIRRKIELSCKNK